MPKPAIHPERLSSIRRQVLRYIYENGAGEPDWMVDDDDIQKSLNLTKEEFGAAWMVLHSQGMLPHPGVMGSTGLSRLGLAAAERLGPAVLMQDPPQPPAHVIVNQGNNNIVQVAGHHSNQSATLSIQQNRALQLVEEIERALPASSLDAKTKADAADLITSLKDGLKKGLSSAVTKTLSAALASLLSPAGSALTHRAQELIAILTK